ncbi:cation:proton antiporter [Halomarina rubra]|uniref:Cation:proton antiporter n=1 Tax=Halomarina rubra TaxID=2071873 RepID=A0ABD6AQ19_9EURY
MTTTYLLGLVVVGVVVLAAAVLPELLSERALSPALVYLAFGAVVFSLPLGWPSLDPIANGVVVERLSEFVVVVSLMSAGLKLDRPFDVRSWSTTWRLLAVTMPLTIAGAVLAGWWVLGLAPATAVLLGAVLAPTDPVLASDVQVGPPGEGEDVGDDPADLRDNEHEVRFALTSEAGLNDGLAFPFVYVAVLVATSGVGGTDWVGTWLGTYVVGKILVGVVGGLVCGTVLAELLFRAAPTTRLARTVEGIEALGGTLVVYGATELVQGYGFVAVFVAALVIRHRERSHEYNQALHDFAEVTERLVVAVLIALFGGMVASGLLAPLTWPAVAVALVVVFVLRPFAGGIGLLGTGISVDERAAIAFFGIRGIGSFYYLAYALEQTTFVASRFVWALVGFVVLTSLVVHGVVATPAMRLLSRRGEA